jgi:hypothetical protein
MTAMTNDQYAEMLDKQEFMNWLIAESVFLSDMSPDDREKEVELFAKRWLRHRDEMRRDRITAPKSRRKKAENADACGCGIPDILPAEK